MRVRYGGEGTHLTPAIGLNSLKQVRCPFCGCEGGFKIHKTWRFRFYEVKQCT